MKRLQQVIWTKGTFLTPQHLQIQDRFLENLLQFQLECLSFRPWGFRTLQISQEALAGGALGISSASGILPDGLLFDIPDSRRRASAQAAGRVLRPGPDHLDLYLAVPQYRDRGMNVATSPRDAGARFRAEIKLFRDENTGHGGEARPGRPQEPPPAHRERGPRGLLHPARGARDAAARPAPFSSTRASCRRCSTSTPTSTWSPSRAAWWKSSAARSTAISGMRRQKNQSLADFTAADIANFWLLYTINTFFPLSGTCSKRAADIPKSSTPPCCRWPARSPLFPANIHPRDLPDLRSR